MEMSVFKDIPDTNSNYQISKEGIIFSKRRQGNKLNNSVENLEWCTYSENMKHAVSKGLNKIPRLSGFEHHMHKLTEENVYKIRELFVKG